MHPTEPPPIVTLTCCCCGDYVVGRYRQWHNRDRGYTVCLGCADDERGRGVDPEVLHDRFGVEGINYPARPDLFASGLADHLRRLTASTRSPADDCTGAMLDASPDSYDPCAACFDQPGGCEACRDTPTPNPWAKWVAP